MYVNTQWLQDWVPISIGHEELADKLTMAGLEVESVEPVAAAMSGIVVGEVLSVASHPNADRLSVCAVSDGENEYEVVCGAPNVKKGIFVPFARLGAKLPDGTVIKAAKLRGVQSSGMLCSGTELGLPVDTDGLLVLDDGARAGQPIEEALKLNDHVLDIALTANRGDCFSVLGIAREVAAVTSGKLVGPAVEPVAAVSTASFPVVVEAAEACPSFAGRVIEDIRADARSPLWLRERLRRAGVRPIDPVVDVTNYVLLELGQPMHAYDLDKLQGGIEVRLARAQETLALLDGRNVELAEDVLVIADSSGPIGMAGIMGGDATGVSPATRRIFLESAFFSPGAMAGRARRYGLHTEASLRFERGVDPAGQVRAIERATQLLLEIAGGKPGPTVVNELPGQLPVNATISLSRQHVERVLGLELDDERIENALRRLGMQVERQNGKQHDGHWNVIAPSHRFDIGIPEDLIEEVGRMVGYDSIAPVPASAVERMGNVSESRVAADRVADALVDQGYCEVITYSFVDAPLDSRIAAVGGQIELQNPISSDLAIMRRSLWPGLLQAAQRNVSRQIESLRIFEIGTVFQAENDTVRETGMLAGLAVGNRNPEHWEGKSEAIDFFDIKRDVEILLDMSLSISQFEFRAQTHPALSPAQCAGIYRNGVQVGWLGALHPRLQQELDFKSEVFVFELDIEHAFEARRPDYNRLSKYPSVRRDLAVVVEQDVSADALKQCVREGAGELLQDLVLFDVYRGEGIGSSRKSVAIGLILQDASRTLTDGDADGLVASVARHLERTLGATIRT